MKSSIKNGMTLLCLTVIIAVALPVHTKNKNNNNNGQPLQTQPENGNNSRIQALEAEDIRLQQLIDGLGSSDGPNDDTGATELYRSRV